MPMLEYREDDFSAEVPFGLLSMIEDQVEDEVFSDQVQLGYRFMPTDDLKEEDDFGDQIPVGYRFVPTDEELVTNYFMSKVLCKSLPTTSVFQEINATCFYSKPPKCLVQFYCGEREWFFFIRKNRDFGGQQNKIIRIVGKRHGFWRLEGEKSLYDMNRNVIAIKKHLVYVKGCISKAKKTHWRMDEYRLPIQFYHLHKLKEEWVMGRLTRGSERLWS